MAKTIENKKEISEQVSEQSIVESAKNNEDTVALLMKKLSQMEEELKKMKEKEVEDVSDKMPTSSTSYEKIIDVLTNKRSDKEVIILHNREMLNGLATVLQLNGVTIQFHKLGEQRVLTWQQFEECVSKYRKLFDKEIILLEAGQEDLTEKYDIPSINRGSKYIMTKQKLLELGNLDVHQLEDFYYGLTEGDKKSVLSYWMGKCYEKSAKFYDRYKLETLNRVSSSNVFDNIIKEMETFK